MSENGDISLDYSFLPAEESTISRPRTSFFYLLGMTLVTFTMLLLPVVYLGLAATVAYGVYYFAAHCYPGAGTGGYSSSGRLLIWWLVLYLAVLFAGLVVVFFMFKPLFARQPKRAQPLALNPAAEPLLYAFIERICAIVGAPSPKRIDLDCRVNASAGFRRGLLGMSRNDMVLTIGLPLVANFKAHEFAGVVAHEFGHFTQGAGMRLSYVIDVVNHWFLRVVYQRDAWDVMLEQWSSEVEDGRVGIVIWTAQLGVFFSRQVLKILMFIGFAIGGFMSRQMEYDADAYEIKVSGSESFESTTRKLATLTAALELTHEHLAATWKKYRTLPDNVPELLRQHHERMPMQVHQKINDSLGLVRTSLFASHPSPGDRIRQARLAADPGIYHDDRPASSLFSNFEHPSRFVTLLHYTDDLGVPVTQQMLTPVKMERPAAGIIHASLPTGDHPFDQFFFGLLPLIQPIRLNSPTPSANVDADLAELNQLTAGVRGVADQLNEVRRQYDEATAKLYRARAGVGVIGYGAAVDPARFGKEECSVAAATSAEKEAVATRNGLCNSLHEITPVLTQRFELGLALALANDPDGSTASAIESAVAALNSDAATYELQQELTEAIKVLDEIDALALVWEGSTPIARGRTRQMQVIFALHEKLNPVAVAEAVLEKPGLRIQGSTRQSGSASEQDLNGIKRKAYEWMAGYEQRLGELVKRAAAMEAATV